MVFIGNSVGIVAIESLVLLTQDRGGLIKVGLMSACLVSNRPISMHCRLLARSARVLLLNQLVLGCRSLLLLRLVVSWGPSDLEISGGVWELLCHMLWAGRSSAYSGWNLTLLSPNRLIVLYEQVKSILAKAFVFS